MYADPIVVTLNAVATDLPRVFQTLVGGPSVFVTPDDTLKAEISHQVVKGKRERHLFKITQKAITANPFVPAENIENYASVYLVVDNPRQGFTDADLSLLTKSLTDFLGVGANRDKLIAGEA